jgi:hypothetical protein
MAKREKEVKKLAKLKKNYQKLKAKYGLPEFEELNKEFEIEKAAGIETEYLLRIIRRGMVGKFINFMNFFDDILTASRVSSAMIAKKIDKEKEAMYAFIEKVSVILLKELEREVYYDEKQEAEEIKWLYEEWKRSKEEIARIVKSLSQKKDKTAPRYFG